MSFVQISKPIFSFARLQKTPFSFRQVSADHSIQPSQRRACAQGEGSEEGDVAEPDRCQVQDDPEADCDDPVSINEHE